MLEQARPPRDLLGLSPPGALAPTSGREATPKDRLLERPGCGNSEEGACDAWPAQLQPTQHIQVAPKVHRFTPRRASGCSCAGRREPARRSHRTHELGRRISSELGQSPSAAVSTEDLADALFLSRNLVSLEFAADHLKVSTHAVEKAAGRSQGGLLMWIFGGRGQLMRKYRDVYVDMGPSPDPDLPHAWQGHSAEELLGQARKRHADPSRLNGLDHATS
jgi:hypothetical protein